MPRWFALLVDLVAVTVLVFGIYFPRYRRREMVIAYLGLNVTVLSVATALTLTATVSTAFGIGLFGVLSIVRLRSDEVTHQDVAFYLASLALGLLGGMRVQPGWQAGALTALVLVVMYLGDHPRLIGRYRQQLITLDRAFGDEAALHAELTGRLQADIRHWEVRRVDYVNDTTTVDVRFRVRDAR